MKQSYTSNRIGVRARYRAFQRTWAFHNSEAENRVRDLVALAELCGRRLKEAFGVELSGRRILDVGPGEFLIQSRFFALRNEVVAIDTEVVVEKLTPGACVEMIRRNGTQRAVKTVARKMLGIDRIYERALRDTLGVATLPAIQMLRGDVCQMEFPNECFDVVYSRSVMHHLGDPSAALSEMARVLKPGGVAHVDLHLYTSMNGSLDPRIVFGGDVDFYWAHLRQGPHVVEGAFLNRLRLSEWRALFADQWPGSLVTTIQSEDQKVHQEADRLLSEGNITGYSKEELLATTVVAIWQKRASTGAANVLSTETTSAPSRPA